MTIAETSTRQTLEHPTAATPALRVVLLAPSDMDARYLVQTPILPLLAQQREMAVTVLTESPHDQELIMQQGGAHLAWAPLQQPAARPRERTRAMWQQQVQRLAYRVVRRLLPVPADFGNLVFRFNHLHQFAAHRYKQHFSAARKQREAKAGNFVDPVMGKPFPDSWRLFRLLAWLYYHPWGSESGVEHLFATVRPHLLVLTHAQHRTIRPYVAVARRRGIPMVGIVWSWDRPTTKGPLPPGVQRYAVHSSAMRDDLVRYHAIAPQHITITGWPQMDFYRQPGIIQPREPFLRSLGIPPERRLVLFGANSKRLGRHEPAVMQAIAQRIREEAYGKPGTLLIRPHPKDHKWERRFAPLHDPPYVIVQPAEQGRLDYLTNLLYHADVVIASQGSISLDALALDSCLINIAFDGDAEVAYAESVCRTYEMDHYAGIAQSGAVHLVRSYAELDAALTTCLHQPEANRAAREWVRQAYLEPFDGCASERMVAFILHEARRSARNAEEHAYA